jgi:hypothetical protein
LGGGGTLVTVKAGPGAFGIGPTLPMNRRSIGLVQQLTSGGPNDFPAQSFFNIYIELDLPGIQNTASYNDFPVVSGVPVAVLYNDVSDPLLIENSSLTSLPPVATYIHQQTTAVPIRFRDSNPPYWAANDVLGYLTLAGHGVFTNVVTAQAPCAAAQAPGGLLDQTLGPVGSPIPPPPIPWLQPVVPLFPATNSTYNSIVNSFTDPVSGLSSVLDATVQFTIGTTTYFLRDLVVSNLTTVHPFPPVGSPLTFSQSQVVFYSLSMDGMNFLPQVPASGIVGTATMTVTNEGTTGPVTNFATEFLQLTANGSNPFAVGGTLFLRESPTLMSKGSCTVQADPRGYRVASYFDIFLELSADGVNWSPASNSLRLLVGMPAPTPGAVFATIKDNAHILIDWQNQFTLQSAPSVTGPWSDITGPITGPVTNKIALWQQYFRLRQ